MIIRQELKTVENLLEVFPAVAVLGPRQIGKTTLALEIGKKRDAIYLDLESTTDLNKLTNPVEFFSLNPNKLHILDEVQQMPGLFQELRGVIDSKRRTEKGNGQFLLLGSASMELLKQSSESLAGRIAYCELASISPLEVDLPLNELWFRGGFPLSVLAESDAVSLLWRQNFIKTYLERDIPQLGPRIPSATLRRFWTMLAHQQGSMLNASTLASSLAVDGKTIVNYLDLMVDLMLVQRLQPFITNTGKRLRKSPKVYVRDSGLVHALLGISSLEALLGHPVNGMSWEGFVIEQIKNLLGNEAQAYFYRTGSGNELDLVLQFNSGEIWGIEIKRNNAPKPSKGMIVALEDIRADKAFILIPREDRYPSKNNVEIVGMLPFLRELSTKFL